MNWFFPAAMSVLGGIQGYNSAQDAAALADEQVRLAERNSLLEARELTEQVRRQAEEDYRLRSAALARAAASGARVEGSVADYLDYMEDEQSRQLEWLRSAGASRIRLNMDSALIRADATRTQANARAWGSLISGFTGGWNYMNEGGFFDDTTSVASDS